MAIRKIVELGTDDILRKHARKVVKFDKRLATLLEDMADTMDQAEGVGLAAPQVAVLKRAVVIRADEEAMFRDHQAPGFIERGGKRADVAPNGLLELINPEFLWQEGEVIATEGCLSVPGRRGTVRRPARVRVKAQDRRGEPFEIEATGMLAVCLCHEIDHLDGIVYVDKMIEDVTDRQEDDAEE